MLTSANTQFSNRLQFIDVTRGLIMIIMALDHVRDFFSYTSYKPNDVTRASVFLFSTRWITHLCAPTFVFLAGVSIYLYYRKVSDLSRTSLFLLTRGFWLICVEVIVISFILTQRYALTLLEVIWAIGSSMIFLAALIWLPRWLQALVAMIMIVGHNALPPIGEVSANNVVLALLHSGPFFIPNPPILVAYTIIPWVGVMLLGFAFGPSLITSQAKDRLLIRSGATAIITFIVLRYLNVYGDPSPWTPQERGSLYTVLSYLNVSKYPPSLLFLSITLGTCCLLLVLAERLPSRVKEILATYGRVPFFYFVLHLAMISAASYVWTSLRFGKGINLSFTSPNEWPADYEPSLLRTYLIWLSLVALLYFPCRWYAQYKSMNRAWWISYL